MRSARLLVRVAAVRAQHSPTESFGIYPSHPFCGYVYISPSSVLPHVFMQDLQAIFGR